ncbi:MAG: magnesium transporter [Candidatus Methanospirareceae archaeon]
MRKVGENTISASISAFLMRMLHRIPLFFHDFSDIFKQAPFSLSLCSFTGLLAGVALGFMTNTLELLPGLIVLIPPAIDMRGNIYGALVSRLGTSMHLGLFSPKFEKGSVLYQNTYASMLLTMILSVALGFLAKIVSIAFGLRSVISLFGFILISVIGGLISGIILLGISVLIAVVGYRRNWNIDNISSPIITSAGDVVTIPSLYLAALLFLNSSPLITTILSYIFIFAAILCCLGGFKAKDTEVRRIIVESIPMLLICGIIDAFAGMTLEKNLESLISIPALLVLIPPFLGECNGLAGILSARLSSMLHIGMIDPEILPDRKVLANFAVIYILSIFLFSLVGALSYLASKPLGISSSNSGINAMLSISFLGGVLCTAFLSFASYYIAILSFRLNMDPDNETIPLITSLTDIAGVLCLLFTINVIF